MTERNRLQLFPQIRVGLWGMAWRKTATDCSSCGMIIHGPSSLGLIEKYPNENGFCLVIEIRICQ